MYELRYYQREAADSVFSYFETCPGNPLICMPTGTGKSLVIAEIVRRILTKWPCERILALTHVKELIVQNTKTLTNHWPAAPVGIFSSGLNQKDIALPIIFGGVASVIRSVEKFGHIDLLLIDEAHLLSPKGSSMYQKLIAALKKTNPKLKVIGLTATPFRLGQGKLTEDGLFTDICYDLTEMDAFNRLVAEGFIAPLIPQDTKTKLDISKVGIQQGEYKAAELEQAVDKDEVTYRALTELVTRGQNRHSWLIFASGIQHAEHIANMLNGHFDILTGVVHSKLTDDARDTVIQDFKNGNLRAIVNQNVLTTGFDHPPIDLIGMLRPTMSPGLFVQMLGRGTRPSEGKINCLCLDFAGNTERLGPINDPVLPKAKKGEGGGTAPVKICQVCGAYNHTKVRFCIQCGTEFQFDHKLKDQASSNDLIASGEAAQVEIFDVSHVSYNRHENREPGKFPTLKATYYSKLHSFTEYVCIEHPNGNYAKVRAKDWFRQRIALPLGLPEGMVEEWIPETVDQGLMILDKLRRPSQIKVWVNRKWNGKVSPQILGYIF